MYNIFHSRFYTDLISNTAEGSDEIIIVSRARKFMASKDALISMHLCIKY